MKTKRFIHPRTLSGFRDIMPSTALIKENMVSTIKKVFRAYGFSPIETPHLEYSEILLGKGGEQIQKQLYQFLDNGGREVTLRYDHTVPLARFVSQHKGFIRFPFKRYVVGNVFRGESPQAGRYREFTQCDFDFIGTDSIAADSEVASVIHDALKALKFKEFTVFVSNRKIINGFVEKIGASDRIAKVLRILDKIHKIGENKVLELLKTEASLSKLQATELLQFILSVRDDSLEGSLKTVKKYSYSNEMISKGIDELDQFFEFLYKMNVDMNRYKIDLSIARGLLYYTSIVYETVLDNFSSLGSVASGGRYDELTKCFCHDMFPGVGASIGLDRLMVALEHLNMESFRSTPADILIGNIETLYVGESLSLGATLRKKGCLVEVLPEPKKINKLFSFAQKKGYKYLIVFGKDQAEKRNYILSNLFTGEKTPKQNLDELVNTLAKSKE